MKFKVGDKVRYRNKPFYGIGVIEKVMTDGRFHIRWDHLGGLTYSGYRSHFLECVNNGLDRILNEI